MKKLLLSLSVLCICAPVLAQRYLGVSTGSYNTINSMYLNPANLGGCNEKLAINLFSVNVGVDNNLGTITSISDISNTTNGDSGSSNLFKISGTSGKFSMMVPSVELRGPGVLYRLSSKHTLALTTRVRAFNEFNNFDRALYTAIDNPSGVNQAAISFNAQNFNWTAHVWSEIGISYGGVLYDGAIFKVKGGATLRYLAGIGYLGVKGRNMDVSYSSGADSFRANNTDIEYASNIQTLSDGFTNGVSTSNLFGGQSGGKGLGADLGAVIMFKPGKEDGDYMALLSVAVTDLGAITYKTSYNVLVKGNGYIKGSDLSENVKNYEDLRRYAATKGFTVDTGTKSTKVYLPTALVVSADYHAYKMIYVNATMIANMASDQNFGSKYYGQITITPRLERKIASVALPISYSMLSHTLRLGFGARISGFFLGSDDMMANFSKNQYGYNAYFGGMIPINRKPKSRNNY